MRGWSELFGFFAGAMLVCQRDSRSIWFFGVAVPQQCYSCRLRGIRQCGLRLARTPFAPAARKAAVPLVAFKSVSGESVPLHAAAPPLHADAATDHHVARRAPPKTRRPLRDPRRSHGQMRRSTTKTHDVESVLG